MGIHKDYIISAAILIILILLYLYRRQGTYAILDEGDYYIKGDGKYCSIDNQGKWFECTGDKILFTIKKKGKNYLISKKKGDKDDDSVTCAADKFGDASIISCATSHGDTFTPQFKLGPNKSLSVLNGTNDCGSQDGVISCNFPRMNPIKFEFESAN